MLKSPVNTLKRGDIFIANLDPSFGREIHKKRPVLIVSDNDLNKTLPTVVIIPFSSIVPLYKGPEIVSFKSKGLAKQSILVVSQIRGIDKVRITKKIGKLPKIKLLELERSLKLVLGL